VPSSYKAEDAAAPNVVFCLLSVLTIFRLDDSVQLLDDDMDGFVNFEELKASFIKVAEMSKGEVKVPSDALLKQMIAEASSEGGNQISFDDFGALMDVLPAPQAAAAGV
jgi:Ca2+-binding EF-hand superfamily protein